MWWGKRGKEWGGMRGQDGCAGGGRAKAKAKAANGGKVSGGARGNGASATLCRRDGKKNKKGLRVGNGVARGGGGSENSKTTAAAKGAKRGSAVGKRKTLAEVLSLLALLVSKYKVPILTLSAQQEEGEGEALMALQEAEEEEEAAIIALQVCRCGCWCMCDV